MMKNKVNYVVFTTQRTGSTWLMDLFNQIDDVEGHLELFLKMRRKKPGTVGFNDFPRFVESRDSLASGIRPFATWKYLNSLYGRPGAVGFKLMYSHLAQHPEILGYLAARRIPVIHLIRPNVLDIVISKALSDRLGQAHAHKDDEVAKSQSTRVVLDIDVTINRLRKLKSNEKWAKRMVKLLPYPVHEVLYDDLKEDRKVFLDICEFLRLPCEPSHVRDNLIKRQTLPYHESIENYDAVRDALVAEGLDNLLRK